MGFLDVPETDNVWIIRYSYFCKFMANLFIPLPFIAYLLKWGVAWHAAGSVFSYGDTKFSSYWNMICILYFSLGIYYATASFDPVAYRTLLSYAAWGAGFAHGVIATIACFSDDTDYGYSISDSLPNIDKLFIAVPIWFGSWGAHLFFMQKIYGSYELPWTIPCTTDYKNFGSNSAPAV